MRASYLLVTAPGGVEGLAEAEVRKLGYRAVVAGPGLVRVEAPAAAVGVLNAQLRTASRVLVPLVFDRVTSWDDVYRVARRVEWEDICRPLVTFAVQASTRRRDLSDHRFLAMRVKDAIVDRQRAVFGRRSSVDRRTPDVTIVAHIDTEGLTLSLDSTGAPLHERGYRTEAGEAPLRETVAAAMVQAAGWPPAPGESGSAASTVFLDPMCGSGTIAIEAACALLGRGTLRDWAWQSWPAIDAIDWDGPSNAAQLLVDARDRESADGSGVGTTLSARRLPRIIASDHDGGLIAIARRNAERAGVAEVIEFVEGDIADGIARAAARADELWRGDSGSSPGGVVVTNPPYGVRLNPTALPDVYHRLGSLIRDLPSSWRLWLIAPHRELHAALGLRASERLALYNGALKCTYACYPAGGAGAKLAE